MGDRIPIKGVGILVIGTFRDDPIVITGGDDSAVGVRNPVTFENMFTIELGRYCTALAECGASIVAGVAN